MKTILFRLDINRYIGSGHFYRSFSLALILKDYFKISFAISNPPNNIIKLLKSENFFIYKLDKKEYKNLNQSNDEGFSFDLDRIIDNVSIVILDGYWFRNKYQKSLRSFNKKIVIIDDYGKGQFYADMIINPAIKISNKKYVLDSKKTLFATGKKFVLLRQKFYIQIKKKKRVIKKIKNILICFGGADYLDLTFKYVNWLIKNTDYSLNVVIGSSYKNINKLKKISKKKENQIKLFHSINEHKMIELMLKSDLGIVPCSGLIHETIACQLPVMSGYYTDNQKKIYSGLKEKKIFIDLGNLTDLDLYDAFKNIRLLELKNIINRQYKFFDTKVKKRYIKLFKSLC